MKGIILAGRLTLFHSVPITSRRWREAPGRETLRIRFLEDSLTEERKEAIDRRCASLGISRSDYLNELVTRELAQGPNAKFIISPVELEPKKRPGQGPPN